MARARTETALPNALRRLAREGDFACAEFALWLSFP
jgi:hypothetical protein